MRHSWWVSLMLSNPVSQEPVIWFFMIVVVVLWSIEFLRGNVHLKKGE